MLENALSAPYLQEEWMDLTKLAKIYCFDIEFIRFFVNLTPVFKFILAHRLIECKKMPCLHSIS